MWKYQNNSGTRMMHYYHTLEHLRIFYWNYISFAHRETQVQYRCSRWNHCFSDRHGHIGSGSQNVGLICSLSILFSLYFTCYHFLLSFHDGTIKDTIGSHVKDADWALTRAFVGDLPLSPLFHYSDIVETSHLVCELLKV